VKSIDYNIDGSWDKHHKRIEEMHKFLKDRIEFKWNPRSTYVDDYIDDELFFGVGKHITEFDHDLDPKHDGDWEDYTCPSPPIEFRHKVDVLKEEFEKEFSDMIDIDSFGLHAATYYS